MAAEVAAVSRNVVIRGRWGCDPMCGHFMLAHTPHGHICGVEFTNLGQSGAEGRYPLHVHMPGTAPDVLVRHNAVHDTMNRGIVLHGVHNMTLQYNLCYKSKGHCIMLEDGVEQYNRIGGNLAVLVAPLDFGCESKKSFTCPDRSDSVPNGFWIPNPNNYFHGNRGVVAGTAFHFETRHVTGLTRRKYHSEAMKVGSSGKTKGRTPLAQFTMNAAHSCHGGVGNYPKLSFRGDGRNAYEFFTAWRCYRGMSAHTGANPMRITHALLVENTVGIRGALPDAELEVSQTRMTARLGWVNYHHGTAYVSSPFIINKFGKTTADKIIGVFDGGLDDYTRSWVRCHGGYDAEALNYSGELGNWFELFAESAHSQPCPPFTPPVDTQAMDETLMTPRMQF